MRRQRDREDDDRRAVVEQALSLDQRGEAGRRTEPPEDRDDGNRVGRGDDRTDDECDVERQPGRQVEDHGDDRGRDDDAGRGEHDHPAEGAPQLANVDLVGRLEDEARQQHRENEVRRDLEPGRGRRSRRPARPGQGRRRRAVEPLRGEGDERGDRQQDREGFDGRKHRPRFRGGDGRAEHARSRSSRPASAGGIDRGARDRRRFGGSRSSTAPPMSFTLSNGGPVPLVADRRERRRR